MANLIFRVLDPPMDLRGHTHSFAHILIPLTNDLDLTIKGQQYAVSNQELCFIPPSCFHHCYCPAEVITMNIPPHMIKQSDLAALEDKIVFSVEDNLVPLIQLIKMEVPDNPTNDSMRYLFYYLYSKLVETYECRSLRYIREHFNEPISVEDLAHMENYNPTYFADWFRRKTGFTPSTYLRDFRAEKAMELLANTQYSLLEIALQVGYNSHSAFTRAFKESTGESPLQYRRSFIENREF